jgi:hypothetical protein
VIVADRPHSVNLQPEQEKMMAGRKAVVKDDLEAARTRFEHWRKSRSRAGPIPDGLWAGAINAARSAGVNRTTQHLYLDAAKQKRLVLAADSKTSQPPRGPSVGTGSQSGWVDALELPGDVGAGWRIITLAWPKRGSTAVVVG